MEHASNGHHVERGPFVEKQPDMESTGVDRQYLGHFESLEAFAEQFAVESGLLDRLQPPWLRAWLRLDREALARDLAFRLIVVRDPNGGVHIFDPSR
jgi:hypothetical protein